MVDEIKVVKASGAVELFERGKLESSLHNSGASRESIKKVIRSIEAWIYDGVSTKLLYARAFNLLRKIQVHSATRFRLKKAIQQLGPSGYPFELFVGLIFQSLGYKTEVGMHVEGDCISHEMDVIANKANEELLMECKYHADPGRSVGIQVPLYVKSRVDDIVGRKKRQPKYSETKFATYVVTNTRFSPDAIHYARCANIKLLGWDYPKGKGIKELIEQAQIYPVTILSQLSLKEKKTLLDQGIVSCRQACEKSDVVNNLLINSRKKKAVIKELNGICEGKIIEQ
jgi:hypothetical protein